MLYVNILYTVSNQAQIHSLLNNEGLRFIFQFFEIFRLKLNLTLGIVTPG